MPELFLVIYSDAYEDGEQAELQSSSIEFVLITVSLDLFVVLQQLIWLLY